MGKSKASWAALWSVVAAFACGVFAPRARAEQFVLVDVDYTHTLENYSYQVSHYRVLPVASAPADWGSPIDYEHGTIHTRVEVFSMASANGIRWMTAYEQHPVYVCGHVKAINGPGVYEWDSPIANLDCDNPDYDWGKSPTKLAFILRDSNSKKIDIGQGFIGEPDHSLYLPFHARVTMTIVANGSTYEEPVDEPDAGPDATDTADASITAPTGDGAATGSNDGDTDAAGDGGADTREATGGSAPSGAVSGGCSLQRRSQPTGFESWLALLAGLALTRARTRTLRAGCTSPSAGRKY